MVEWQTILTKQGVSYPLRPRAYKPWRETKYGKLSLKLDHDVSKKTAEDEVLVRGDAMLF